MRKRIIICILLVMLAIVIVCIPGWANKVEYRWRFAGVTPVTHPHHTGPAYFAKRVNELTNGRVEIELYPAMQLGDPVEIINQVQDGTIELGICVAYAFIDGRFNLPLLPYLVEDYDSADRLIWGDSWLSKAMSDIYEDNGIKNLAPIENGFRGISNNVRPIKKPADLKGLKLRDPGFATYSAFYDAMGAINVTIPYSELYTSLQRGVCDGQDNGPINTIVQKFSEVQKYYTWTKHAISYIALGMNKDLFDSLPNDIQKVLVNVGKETTKKTNDEMRNMYEAKLKELTETGVEVITFDQLLPEDQEAFRKIGISVWPQFEDKIGKDLMDKAYAEIGGRP